MAIDPVFDALGNVSRYKVLLEKGMRISMNLVSRSYNRHVSTILPNFKQSFFWRTNLLPWSSQPPCLYTQLDIRVSRLFQQKLASLISRKRRQEQQKYWHGRSRTGCCVSIFHCYKMLRQELFLLLFILWITTNQNELTTAPDKRLI